MKKYWFPCLLTLLNIVSGFVSMLYAIKGNLFVAYEMIILAMFFDTIDGRIARFFNATSDFGKELDSLADLASFGIAPALILYLVLANVSQISDIVRIIVPVIFVICGAMRLARYNTLNIKDHFVGLPIPVAAGLLLLSILLFSGHLIWLIIGLSLIISIMMVASFKLPRI